MKILFLHGWTSTPGGLKPTYLKDHGHEVLNPALPDNDFEAAVNIAQAEYDRAKPDVVVGSSRGGAVAMNLDVGNTPLVLLCPAWRRWGTATKVKSNTAILHSRADEVVPFADSEELVKNSGLDGSALIEVGSEHRLADDDSLKAMLDEAGRAYSIAVWIRKPLAPEPILKAGLMTLHRATVIGRNWTYLPDVPVTMVHDLMEAIHEVPSILMHWKEAYSFEDIIFQLSKFDQQAWKQNVDEERFMDVPNLVEFFRRQLREFGGRHDHKKN
ncbi:MAG: hypothetical protein JW888_02665 [Pirellulales bacterium]|nr:hypothetical protein [Pirellulales bacterium]